MELDHVDNAIGEILERSVYHPDRKHGTTKPGNGDNLDRTLHLSTLDNAKINSQKRITNFQNGNLPTISDSDEIQITEENENVDIICSVINKNQCIKTEEDIRKKDFEASFDFSSDFDLLSPGNSTDSTSNVNNIVNAILRRLNKTPTTTLICFGAGLIHVE